MTEAQQRAIFIDTYINLLRIQAKEKAENRELERQIKIAKIKCEMLSVDVSELEKLF